MPAFNEDHIRKYIITLPFIGVIVTSIVLTVLFINQINKSHQTDIEQLKSIYQKHAKQIVRDRINNIITIIKQKEVLFKYGSNDALRKNIQDFLNDFRFKDKGYIFAYDLRGNTISHIKSSLVGKNRWKHEKDGQKVVQNIIKSGQEKDGAFLYYTATLNPNKTQSSKKISYVKKIPNINWVIGTGIYTDNFEQELKEKEGLLNLELEETIKKTIFISFILTIFGIFIMLFIANNILKIIKRYKKILVSKNENLEEKVKERTKEQDTLLSLFDEADTVLFKWDYKTQKLIYVSKSIYKIFGFKEEEFLNQTITYKECIHKDDFEKFLMQYQDAINENKQYYEHKPYRIITKDNQIKWIHDYTLFVKDNNNELTYLLGYITDITMIKEYDRTISEQSKMASLGEMLGNIAHQWRQPLSTISTAASGMKLHKEMDLLTDETFDKSINGIMQNSNYLSDTINDFTNYIKNSSICEDFIVSDVLEKNLLLLDGNIKINHIKVIKEFDNVLKIYGSRHNLIQVIMNIINNAIDVLKEQDQVLNKLVFISTEKSKDNVCIKIKDNAGGISKDIIDKIFEPYFTTKHQSQGTGLGLYMAHNLVSNMNGTISVSNTNFEYENKEYDGALFTIELPLYK